MKPIFESKNKVLNSSLLIACSLMIANASNAESFTFSQLPLSEQLIRPGVGFQEPNRRLPTAAELNVCNDPTKPPSTPSSVPNNRQRLEDAGIKTGATYLRVHWQEIEPAHNQYNFSRIRDFLKCANRRGHAVDFRVMLTDPFRDDKIAGLPSWLVGLEVNGESFGSFWSKFGNSNLSYRVPNFDNAVLWKEHAELIQKLGEEFNGHKDLNSIDIGSVGFWGEWHYFGDGEHGKLMPSYETQEKIIKLYEDYFPNTPKVALEGAHYDSKTQRVSSEPYKSPTANLLRGTPSIGWRADSWGSKNFTERYRDLIGIGGLNNTWKTGMVALEIQFENMGTLKQEDTRTEDIAVATQLAKDFRVSTINSKQGEFPTSIRERTRDLSAKMGYRLALRSINYESPTPAGAGTPLLVSMKWQNEGIAPLYRNFVVAFRLRDTASGKIVFATKTGKSLRMKPPGLHDINPNMYIDGGVPTGIYALDTALVFDGEKFRNDYSARIPIAIGNTNRIRDKWVHLGDVNVTGGGGGVAFVPDTVGESTGGNNTGDGGNTNTGAPSANPDNESVISGVKESFYPLVNDIGNDKALNEPNPWSQNGGSVRLINNNQITYQSKSGFTGVDKIYYVMRHSQGTPLSSVINITVNSVAAKANPDQMFATTGVSKPLYPLANDEGTGKSLIRPNAWSQRGGTVAFSNTGIVYTSKAGFAGTDKIWYTMKDSQGRTSGSVMTISVVAPGASLPTARNDSYTTARNTGKVLNILSNDSSNGGGIAIDNLYSYTAKGGWASKTSDGKVWYKPKDGFTGVDNFWYVIINSGGRKDSAKVEITVN